MEFMKQIIKSIRASNVTRSSNKIILVG